MKPMKPNNPNNPTQASHIQNLDPDNADLKFFYNSELGYNVKSFRQSLGVSTESLSERTGICLKTVKKIEAGRMAYPKIHHISMIAFVFGIPVSKLMPDISKFYTSLETVNSAGLYKPDRSRSTLSFDSFPENLPVSGPPSTALKPQPSASFIEEKSEEYELEEFDGLEELQEANETDSAYDAALYFQSSHQPPSDTPKTEEFARSLFNDLRGALKSKPAIAKPSAEPVSVLYTNPPSGISEGE